MVVLVEVTDNGKHSPLCNNEADPWSLILKAGGLKYA